MCVLVTKTLFFTRFADMFAIQAEPKKAEFLEHAKHAREERAVEKRREEAAVTIQVI